MKKILLFLLLIPSLAFSQVHSWDGKGIASNAKLRCLNIFVNIIYDVHPSYNDRFSNSEFWPPITDPALEGINNAAIPTYLLDWMDTVYVPGQLHGSCTRLYGESSFDSLQIIGDFVVLNIRESTILNQGPFNTYTISIVANNIVNTHQNITLYVNKPITYFNAKNILIRNITKEYGGLNPGSGYGGRNTLQCVGDGNIAINPTNIVTHEISHGLFGDNAFHTSGGNHRHSDQNVMSFLNIQGGYGLMGAANSGLVGCNGYERWRMHWKHPQATDYISARNSSNTQSITSDISIEDGNKTFILRDFVTYGDVVRIKLPYKDSETSSNQYIWLENHKVGSNGKLDFLQFSNTDACRPVGAAGIYAYYQIGRDVLEGTSGQVWDSKHRDNLRIISAEGFYDYEKIDETYNLQCVSYSDHNYTLRRGAANPLCGAQDQEYQLFPNDEDSVLYVTSELAPWRIVKNGQNCDNLSFIGDNYDAFTLHTKLNMGTNPSTNNAKTFHSYNYEPPTIIKSNASELNVQTTYLTGLSIEMQPVGQDGDFLVNVRWDDYEIANDARWTGKIELKDTAILTTANTLTLAQNRTVAKDKRDSETGLFAGRTKFTCKQDSYFRQDSATTVNVTENSEIFFESGSYYKLSEGATLKIEAGSRVVFDTNAIAQIYGNIEVDSGGVLVVYDTTTVTTKSAKTYITTPDETNTTQTVSIDDATDNVDTCYGASLQQTRSGYESFFGKNSWEYAAAFLRTMFVEDYDPYYLHTDTEIHNFSVDRYEIINGKKYYKSEGTYFDTEYIREDTTTGRLYTYTTYYDKEFLMCDMSLEKGDTFTLSVAPMGNGLSSEVMIVDSISYVNSKKQIHLKPLDCYYSLWQCLLEENVNTPLNVSMRFMEGVGPIYGISPLVGATGNNLQLLLCLHKDDTLNYMTHPVLGCYQYFVNVPEYPESFLSVYPNPANNVLNISFADVNEIDGTLLIRDVVGRVCYHNKNLNQNFSSINVANYSKGVYFVTFIDKKNRTITKKFVKM